MTPWDRAPDVARPQCILVFQGGGALGSYQAGVYEAVHNANMEPDWIIGTSIGAINAALIAGNEPSQRVTKLRQFWTDVQIQPLWSGFPHGVMSNLSTVLMGLPNFFSPNLSFNMGRGAGSGHAAFYSAAPLRATLSRLVDFEILNSSALRTTVGAANVRNSTMRYFDTRNERLTIDHILASGALPPAFPAVEIDGELYWDGGILSNSPTEIVFEDNPRRDALMLVVNVWNPTGDAPRSLTDVLHRQKDIQYSSRMADHVERQKQTHRLRHVISELESRLPPELRDLPEIKSLAAFGCRTRMHVVQLLAPRHDDDGFDKDVDFSASGIARRWKAGYDHATATLSERPWLHEFDSLEGVIVHETRV